MIDKNHDKNSEIPESTSLKFQRKSLSGPMTFRQVLHYGLATITAIIIIRIFFVEIFVVPTDSMSPTIRKGEKVIVNKTRFFVGIPARIPLWGRIYHPIRFTLFSPQRNNVIVFFRTEQEKNILYVKRIHGIPHDTLQWTDSLLRINSKTQRISSTWRDGTWLKNVRTPLIIPRSGDTIRITGTTIELYRQAIELEGNQIHIQNNIVYFNGKPQNYYIVRYNYYFVIGDNSMNSYDSRFYGFVPENTIYGSPISLPHIF